MEREEATQEKSDACGESCCGRAKFSVAPTRRPRAPRAICQVSFSRGAHGAQRRPAAPKRTGLERERRPASSVLCFSNALHAAPSGA